MAKRRRKPRRRAWPIIAGLLVVALGAGWFWLWHYAAGKVETTIAGWKAREARVGRIYDCASQSIGGFPFRIEVHCAGPGAELRSHRPPLALKAKVIVVSAQLWQPTVLTSSFTGPLTVGEPGQSATVAVNWRRAETQVHGLPTSPERIVLAVDEPVVDQIAERRRIFQAERVDVDGRILDGSARRNPVIEIALNMKAAVAPLLHPAAAQATDAEVVAVLTGLKDFRPKSWPARLREIEAAGGKIEITRARLRHGEAIMIANGTLRLTSHGRLDGELRVTVANLDRLLPALGLDRSAPRAPRGDQAFDRLLPGLGNLARRNAAPTLALGLALLGQPTELEGQRAHVLPLRFVDGTVTLGPFPIGQTPALF